MQILQIKQHYCVNTQKKHIFVGIDFFPMADKVFLNREKVYSQVKTE